MSEHRVIQADYSNWRTVAGRKVLQLVFEVPIEQTADVMEKLGVPMPGENKWCAIALLDIGACASGNGGGKRESAPKQSSASEVGENRPGNSPTPINARIATAGTSLKTKEDRRPFASMPMAQQAGIRCQDARFLKFLGVKYFEDAGSIVRTRCMISSRSELNDESNNVSRDLWTRTEREFQEWLTDQQYAGARHG